MSSVFELRVIFMALDTNDLGAIYAPRLAELEVLASSCDREIESPQGLRMFHDIHDAMV
jgi:hypothetical protein